MNTFPFLFSTTIFLMSRTPAATIGNSIAQEVSKEESAGLSFRRLVDPLIDVLLRATTDLKEKMTPDQELKVEQGWMAIKNAIAQQQQGEGQ